MQIGDNNDRNEKVDLDGHQLLLRDFGVFVDLGDGRDRGAEVEIEVGTGFGDDGGAITCSRTQFLVSSLARQEDWT